MDYIKGINYQLQIIENHQVIYLDMPFIRWVNEMIKAQFVSIQTRERMIKRYFRFKRKIPLLLNKDHLLLCINSHRSYHLLYINYHQIMNWIKDKNQVIIIFKSGHCLRLKSYEKFINQVYKARCILSDSIGIENNLY
jgi:hypothetical protein